MNRLSPQDSTDVHVHTSRFHLRAVKRYPATQNLARPWAGLISAARTAERNWEDAGEAEEDAHADVLLADHEADDLLRELLTAAELSDQKAHHPRAHHRHLPRRPHPGGRPPTASTRPR